MLTEIVVDNPAPPKETDVQSCRWSQPRVEMPSTENGAKTWGRRCNQRSGNSHSWATGSTKEFQTRTSVKHAMTIGKTRDQQHAHDQAEADRRIHHARQQFLDNSYQPYHDVSVPFCRGCINSSGEHHSLCPKHPLFAKSGALERLERHSRRTQNWMRALYDPI